MNALLRLQGQELMPLPAYPVPSSTSVRRGSCLGVCKVGEGVRGVRAWERGARPGADRGERGCLQTAAGRVPADTPPAGRAAPGPAEPRPSAARAGSTAAPAGQRPSCGAGRPSTGSPAGESLALLLQLSDQKMSGSPGRRMSPSDGFRPFQSPPVFLILPRTPRTLTEGPP